MTYLMEKVNLTENLAAFHPKYRNDYNENEDSINAISQYKNFLIMQKILFLLV